MRERARGGGGARAGSARTSAPATTSSGSSSASRHADRGRCATTGPLGGPTSSASRSRQSSSSSSGTQQIRPRAAGAAAAARREPRLERRGRTWTRAGSAAAWSARRASTSSTPRPLPARLTRGEGHRDGGRRGESVARRAELGGDQEAGRTHAESSTSSAPAQRREQRRRSQRDLHLAAGDTRSRRARAPSRAAPRRTAASARLTGRERQRPGLDRPVGESRRVADREELERDQPGEEQRGDAREHLDRGLARRAESAIVGPDGQRGAGADRDPDSTPGIRDGTRSETSSGSPFAREPVAQHLGYRAARRRDGVAADVLRAGSRPRGVRARPQRPSRRARAGPPAPRAAPAPAAPPPARPTPGHADAHAHTPPSVTRPHASRVAREIRAGA